MVAVGTLIVGGGHGGAQAAISLRQNGFEGSITIVNDEADYPYERPPLSKEYLAGEKPFDRIMLRPAPFWKERGIHLVLSDRVVAIDARDHSATLRSGTLIHYERMIWAAGGAPRKLACDGAAMKRVHSVRTRDDVDRMRSELAQVRDIVVIGGGYIGLETTAVLRKLGYRVTILETLDRVLARVAGAPISSFYEAEHRRHGVDIRTNVAVGCIEGADGRATGVRLADGHLVKAELIIVGIGIAPNVGPLAEAGATATNGVHVDQHCRTSLPDIFAIGDCALHRSKYASGSWIRLESVQNANDQAQTVARWITGNPQPYETVPWFWSNQYDLKLQTVGVSTGFDDLVVRGNPESRSFSVVYLREGRVAALDCINDVRDYAQGKALVARGAIIPREQLSDRSIQLRALGGSELVAKC